LDITFLFTNEVNFYNYLPLLAKTDTHA